MWETISYYMLNVAVAPREGRVSRNAIAIAPAQFALGRAQRGACE